MGPMWFILYHSLCHACRVCLASHNFGKLAFIFVRYFGDYFFYHHITFSPKKYFIKKKNHFFSFFYVQYGPKCSKMVKKSSKKFPKASKKYSTAFNSLQKYPKAPIIIQTNFTKKLVFNQNGPDLSKMVQKCPTLKF